MANPQIENGHLDLANELVEKLAQTQISGNEMRIIWAIWRKTYCWHKKEDWISYSQFQEVTKIGNWSHISRAIKKLLERNMITKNGNLYGFQKDYQNWQLPKMVTKVTKIGKKRLPKLADTKETITKETITKERETKSKDFAFNNLGEFQDNFPLIDVPFEWQNMCDWFEEKGKTGEIKDWSARFRRWLRSDIPKKKREGFRRTG